MDIKSLKDITDENLKEIKASTIADFVSSQITEKSKEWQTEKEKLDSQLSKANEDYKKISEEHGKVQKTLETLQATVDSLNAEKVEREKVEKFNARMSELSEAYNFDDEVRAALVEEIKALDTDEAFAKFKKKADVLFKGFKKIDKEDKKDGGKDEVKEKAKASESTTTIVDESLDAAKKEKGGIPNTSTSDKQTLAEKYKNAFAHDMFSVKI